MKLLVDRGPKANENTSSIRVRRCPQGPLAHPPPPRLAVEEVHRCLQVPQARRSVLSAQARTRLRAGV